MILIINLKQLLKVPTRASQSKLTVRKATLKAVGEHSRKQQISQGHSMIMQEKVAIMLVANIYAHTCWFLFLMLCIHQVSQCQHHLMRHTLLLFVEIKQVRISSLGGIGLPVISPGILKSHSRSQCKNLSNDTTIVMKQKQIRAIAIFRI